MGLNAANLALLLGFVLTSDVQVSHHGTTWPFHIGRKKNRFEQIWEGLTQGWGSVCRGVGIPFLERQIIKVAKFQSSNFPKFHFRSFKLSNF